MTAWLDYIDARRRLIHEWHEQGVEVPDIALRIEIDFAHVQRIIAQQIDPPLPGCAREQVLELRRRVADLERAIAAWRTSNARSMSAIRGPPLAPASRRRARSRPC